MSDAIIERCWTSLLDKDDRASPENYPDMCLITRGELAAFVRGALDAARSEPTADLQAVEILEAEVPEIIERGARGEALTVSEQAAWTGYELGWRDGRAEPPADLKAVSEVLEPTYDALWELVEALAQHPTLKLGGRLAEALEGGRKAALAEHARRRAAEVYAALNLSETVGEQ